MASFAGAGWHHPTGAANVSINAKPLTVKVVRQFIEFTSISVFQISKLLW
jgi:hypothetical protein